MLVFHLNSLKTSILFKIRKTKMFEILEYLLYRIFSMVMHSQHDPPSPDQEGLLSVTSKSICMETLYWFKLKLDSSLIISDEVMPLHSQSLYL